MNQQTTIRKVRHKKSDRRPAAPSTLWSASVLRLYSRRKKHLARGINLLRNGRLHTLRLSPCHIQGLVYTRGSQFVLVNIHLYNVKSATLHNPEAIVARIDCSAKSQPGLSCYAAATLLGVARMLRRNRQTAQQLLPQV